MPSADFQRTQFLCHSYAYAVLYVLMYWQYNCIRISDVMCKCDFKARFTFLIFWRHTFGVPMYTNRHFSTFTVFTDESLWLSETSQRGENILIFGKSERRTMDRGQKIWTP